ncbi:hypothetical protein C0Q70_14321 [Pomacea canaliculata]|uniref:Uncharacterized protein n=1 Tax=Pomacea canaliculata TaxID=400727 RepID=A0A2T7NZS2_POMCA|nr:hypothetical protein C0Q70_14321 [Pomacea canaliculata]
MYSRDPTLERAHSGVQGNLNRPWVNDYNIPNRKKNEKRGDREGVKQRLSADDPQSGVEGLKPHPPRVMSSLPVQLLCGYLGKFLAGNHGCLWAKQNRQSKNTREKETKEKIAKVSSTTTLHDEYAAQGQTTGVKGTNSLHPEQQQSVSGVVVQG